MTELKRYDITKDEMIPVTQEYVDRQELLNEVNSRLFSLMRRVYAQPHQLRQIRDFLRDMWEPLMETQAQYNGTKDEITLAVPNGIVEKDIAMALGNYIATTQDGELRKRFAGSSMTWVAQQCEMMAKHVAEYKPCN